MVTWTSSSNGEDGLRAEGNAELQDALEQRSNLLSEHAVADDLHNPKLDDHPGSNTEKDPDDWVSGDDPMTGAQGSYLTTLCEEAKVEPPPEGLSKAEASKRIDQLRAELGR